MSVSLKINVPPTKPVASVGIGHNNPPADKVVSINSTSKDWQQFVAELDSIDAAGKQASDRTFTVARHIGSVIPVRFTYVNSADKEVSVACVDAMKGMRQNSKLRSAVRRMLVNALGDRPDNKATDGKSREAVALYRARIANLDRAIHIASVVGQYGKWNDDGTADVSFKCGAVTLAKDAASIIVGGKPVTIDASTTVKFAMRKPAVVTYMTTKNKLATFVASAATLRKVPLVTDGQGKSKAGKGKSIIGNADTLATLLNDPGTVSDTMRQHLTALRSKIDKVLGIVETAPIPASKAEVA